MPSLPVELRTFSKCCDFELLGLLRFFFLLCSVLGLVSGFMSIGMEEFWFCLNKMDGMMQCSPSRFFLNFWL